MKQNGFTLIELLVVISIIGLLSSIMIVSFNAARVKARDAKREADMSQFRNALELYYNDNSGYPAGLTAQLGANFDTPQAFGSSLPAITPTYLSSIPKDPLYPQLNYAYVTDCSAPGPCPNYGIAAYYESTNSWCKYMSSGGNINWWTQATPVCTR